MSIIGNLNNCLNSVLGIEDIDVVFALHVMTIENAGIKIQKVEIYFLLIHSFMNNYHPNSLQTIPIGRDS